MKLIDIINIRNVLKKYYKDTFPYELSRKILFILTETNYIEDDYHQNEANILQEYAELDSNSKPIVEEGHYIIKSDCRDKFFDKISEILLAPFEYHFSEDMYFSEDDLKILLEKCTPEEIKILDILKKE